ncbi:MAG: KH domain-containing protein [Ruminococcaceae bacterium]|nr:KH domain-containing protein [Oscillospiraceae bacterium]
MSETYLVTAKTVEEAVSIANREYGDENHEVSYEIIEMPKKGFLGIGSKDAKIKVTVTETKSVELGSLVADIRSMKNLTDRDGDEDKKSKQHDKQNNQKNNQNKNQDNKQNNQNKQGNKQNNQKNNNKQNNQNNQKNNQKQETKPEKKVEAPAANVTEEKAQPKTRLNNQALPGKRSKQRKPSTADADISASAVTVNAPANLSEFVSEKTGENTFGSSQKASGGRMNNDVRRGKKPPQGKPVSTDTRDRQMKDSKYDVAESDEDYKNIENLERENENLLEREALSSLGLGEVEEVAVPETRTREAVTEAEMQFALEFANTLLKNMKIGAEAVPAVCPEDEELIVTETATVYPKINIIGDDSGILIGHHGETLDSIQYLVNLCALRKTKSKDGDYVKIVVDIENYRQKREETLRSLARRMAAKAVKYKRNVFLEPMNAYERRIIHSELQKYPGVSTHSVGSDRDRKIIVTYEGADKAPDGNRRRRRGGDKKHNNNNQNSAPAKAEAKPAGEKKQHRPRKVQKLSIDQLGDLLDGNETVKVEAPTEE